MLKIKRTYYDGYTSGMMGSDKFKGELITLELPNRNNQENISCIPEGKYIIKKYKSPKFGDCFKIYEYDGNSEVSGRSEILIHIGNFIHETKGSILVGRSKQNGAFIGDTRTALKILLDNLGDEEELIIE